MTGLRETGMTKTATANKTYEMPFSENRVGSFQTIKLTIKHNLQEAEKSGEVEDRQ